MLIIRLCLFLTADSLPASRDDHDSSGDYYDSSLDYLGGLGKNIIYEKCTGSDTDCHAISNIFAEALNFTDYLSEYYTEYYPEYYQY